MDKLEGIGCTLQCNLSYLEQSCWSRYHLPGMCYWGWLGILPAAAQQEDQIPCTGTKAACFYHRSNSTSTAKVGH